MRILWMSNAPWAQTGYGTQTAQITQLLKADGHEIAIAANYGLGAAAIEWNGIPVFPQGSELYSNDLAPAHSQFWGMGAGPVWVLTLYDVWTMRKESWAQIPRIASWTPVDHQPVPTGVLEWAREHPTISMSRFGEAAFKAEGIETTYIPHSIDTDVYQPRETFRSGRPARQILDVPADAFVVMINAANKGTLPNRKAFPEMFIALGRMMRKHTDVFLYLHTEPRPQYGIDLPEVLEAAKVPKERTRFVDQYALKTGAIHAEDVAALYTAADVLLATSRGEGFGIPVIEAQACGTPVIVTNFSAQPELVGAGWMVDGQPDYDIGLHAFYLTPNIAEIAERLEEAYNAKGDAEFAAKARAKAMEYRTADVFAERWRPFIKRLETISVTPNRAQRRAARKVAA